MATMGESAATARDVSRRADTFKLRNAILFGDQHQPWEISPEYVPPSIPSIMCVHELRFLHYVAKHHFSGRGAIVDFGALMGSGAHALAAGIEAGCGRINYQDRSPGLVFCYDILASVAQPGPIIHRRTEGTFWV